MRLRLLDRYLLGAFLWIFGLTALSAPLLFVLADVTGRLEVYLAQGMTWTEILLLYPGQIPTYMTWAFPIAALVATLFTLQPLARHGEIHAALGSGIPLTRLFLPLFVGGAAASLLGIVLLEATPQLGRGVSSWLRDQEGAPAERGAFAYLTDAGELLSAQGLDLGAEGRMSGVVLRSAGTAPGGPVRYVVAAEAVWNGGEGWVLRDGHVWAVAPEGEHRVTSFQRLPHPSLTEGPADLLEAHAVDPAGMSFRELGRFADRLERSGSPAAHPRTKRWERVAIPLTTLVIILFAAPLATVAGRGEGQWGMALSLLATILYLALLRTSEGLGVAGLLHPGLAASLPPLVFGSAGLFLLRRART